MDSTIITRKDDGSTDMWRCRDLAPADIVENERDTPLGDAYLMWSDFVHPSLALDIATPGADERPGLLQTGANPTLAEVFCVDCATQNPFDFRIAPPGRLEQGIRIGDIAPDHMRRLLALDMNYAKSCRRPLYQRIYQRIDGNAQECYRLLLPVLGATSEVAQIYGFCRAVATQSAALASNP
jgi:hypothetical protein